MSTGYSIQATHVADFLSKNVSETLTIGNTGLATTMRIYDCNAPLNGYLLTTSNGVFTINEANNSMPTRVGIGTTTPLNNATLQVTNTILTSNIGTYTTSNTLYFNNTNLSSINNIYISCNINIQGTTNIIGNGTSTLTLGNNTGTQSLILSDINQAQWKITTAGNNLTFYNDNPVGGVFTNSRFYINQNGAVGTQNNVLDDGVGNMSVVGSVTVNSAIIVNGTSIYNGGLITTSNITANSNINVNGVLTAQNLICGSNSSSLSIDTNILNINMNNISYNVYTCSTSSNIQSVNVSNDIMGSQAIVYISATSNISIYGNDKPLGGTNIKSSYTTISVGSNSKALLMVASDGITRYVNCAKFL